MRISPGPTARVSATLTALRVRVEAAWPTGLGCWILASPPQLHFGVFYSEGSHTIQPCLASAQKGPIYCRELGMGNMHPIQACGLWASRRKGTTASSQAGSIARACQQARPSNKSRGTKACICVGGAAEGGTRWSSSWASVKYAAECCHRERRKPVGPSEIFVVEARLPYG